MGKHSPLGPGIRAPRMPLTEPNVHAGTSDRLISEFGKWVGLMFPGSRRCKQKQTKRTGVKIRNKKGSTSITRPLLMANYRKSPNSGVSAFSS